MPPVKKGDNAKVQLAKARAALIVANGRIVGGREWVETLRKAGKK